MAPDTGYKWIAMSMISVGLGVKELLVSDEYVRILVLFFTFLFQVSVSYF